MTDRRAVLTRTGLSMCLALVLGLAIVANASAATTIGQVATVTPPATSCSQATFDTNTEYLEPAVVSGASYVVPSGGVAITSWSTQAATPAGQVLKLKVWRKNGQTNGYQVVGHDGPRTLTPSILNTFSTNLPVQPGDIIGMTVVLNSGDTACTFDSPGNGVLTPAVFGDFNDGESTTFDPTNPIMDVSLNLSAVVGFKASNAIDLGKVKKNKNKGTALVSVDVPGPGSLSLTGSGIKAQRSGGATISKVVTKAGTETLKVKAKGKKKKKLNSTGKVKVKAKITFTPSAVNGDVAGDTTTLPKKIKLIDNG